MISLRMHRALPIASLLSLCILAACGQNSGGEATPSPTVELTGPNARLSNAELLKKAVANMQALESYHFEFRGGIPDEYVKMSQHLSITGDVQLNGKGSGVKITDEAATSGSAGSDPNPDKVLLAAESSVEMLIIEGERSYQSDDGGKTWKQWAVDTPATYLLALFGPPFGSVWDPEGHVTIREETVDRLTLKGGSPVVEQIDGTYTRHIVADARGFQGEHSSPLGGMLAGAKTISFWVSTDITPTVRQMRIEGSNVVRGDYEKPIDTPYTLTWKWNRFNEDFGEVKPPPSESVRSP